MSRPVPVRGVVEGFYGTPWEADARLALIEFMGERDMNAYVYAPKSEPKHRDRWRDPYDEHESRAFDRLASQARACGVRLGFAISPGLDVDYGSDSDRDALIAKLGPLLDTGVDWFVLALDDIPLRPGLAAEQADLAAWLLGALRSRGGDSTGLTLIPTEYVGTRSTPYLAELARRLPPEIDEVMWTGPTVCSPTISAAQARSWADVLGGRPPLLWDNYPVNDGPMERALHLGPYRGRPPELADELRGVLCNPMLQPVASRVALATAADYLRDPAGYDADESWETALKDGGGEQADPLRALASACADGPLSPPEQLVAHRVLDELERGGTDDEAALEAVRQHFSAVNHAARAWSDDPDDPLGRELAPWLSQARTETAAALAAVGLLECLETATLQPDAALLHAFAVVFSWSAARGGNRVVFGPRFAVYPAVVQLGDGSAGLDVDLAVAEDRNAVDRLCRVALAAYRRWANRQE